MSQDLKGESLPPYNVSIVGRNIDVTDGIRNHIMDKIGKLTRFSSRIIEMHIAIEVQKLQHKVDIILKSKNHMTINAHADFDDLYASIDKAIGRLERQLRRFVKRLRAHDAKPIHEVDMEVNVIRPKYDDLEEANDGIEEKNAQEMINRYKFHEVVESEVVPLVTLRVDEAVMKMELSGSEFLIFKCEEEQKLKVIYRRIDEAFGVLTLDHNI